LNTSPSEAPGAHCPASSAIPGGLEVIAAALRLGGFEVLEDGPAG
jgi:hypothetical protein